MRFWFWCWISVFSNFKSSNIENSRPSNSLYCTGLNKNVNLGENLISSTLERNRTNVEQGPSQYIWSSARSLSSLRLASPGNSHHITSYRQWSPPAYNQANTETATNKDQGPKRRNEKEERNKTKRVHHQARVRPGITQVHGLWPPTQSPLISLTKPPVLGAASSPTQLQVTFPNYRELRLVESTTYLSKTLVCFRLPTPCRILAQDFIKSWLGSNTSNCTANPS